MRFLGYILMITLLLAGKRGVGQNPGDSTGAQGNVNIDEVVIRENFHWVTPFKEKALSRDIRLFQSYGNAGELLALTGPVSVKDYGPGASSSSSIRGGAAGHTLLIWEDIPLNSPTLGQSDLSLISGKGMLTLSYLPGPSSLNFGSGALGGGLRLSLADHYNWLPTSIAIGCGSFGDKFVSGNVIARRRKWDYRGMVDYRTARNDYPYANYFVPDSPVERRQSAAFSRLSTQQFLSVKLKDHKTLTAQIWAGGADRDLPPALGTMNSGEFQSDRFVRTMVRYRGWLRNGPEMTAYAAHLYDVYRYQNDSAAIEASGNTHRITGGANVNWSRSITDRDFIQKRRNLKLGMRAEQQFANGDGFPDLKGRNLITAHAQGLWELGFRDPVVELSLRQDLVDGGIMPVCAAAGIRNAFELRKGLRFPLLETGLNIWKDYRLPTLNDLYWVPGGNPQLEPEKLWAAEAEVSLKSNHEDGQRYGFNDDVSATVYYKGVRNWILWQPSSQSSIWMPENVLRVRARGLELSYEMTYRRYLDEWRVGVDLQYTEAVATEVAPGQEASLGKQLIYTPRLQGRGHLNFAFGKAYEFLVSGTYTGRRYILRDHSESLPGYALLNAGISRHVKFKGQRFTIGLDGRNLTGVSYESVARRPMPGRSFMCKLSWDGRW